MSNKFEKISQGRFSLFKSYFYILLGLSTVCIFIIFLKRKHFQKEYSMQIIYVIYLNQYIFKLSNVTNI